MQEVKCVKNKHIRSVLPELRLPNRNYVESLIIFPSPISSVSETVACQASEKEAEPSASLTCSFSLVSQLKTHNCSPCMPRQPSLQNSFGRSARGWSGGTVSKLVTECRVFLINVTDRNWSDRARSVYSTGRRFVWSRGLRDSGRLWLPAAAEAAAGGRTTGYQEVPPNRWSIGAGRSFGRWRER